MDMRCQDGTNTWYLRYLAAADGWAREGEGGKGHASDSRRYNEVGKVR